MFCSNNRVDLIQQSCMWYSWKVVVLSATTGWHCWLRENVQPACAHPPPSTPAVFQLLLERSSPFDIYSLYSYRINHLTASIVTNSKNQCANCCSAVVKLGSLIFKLSLYLGASQIIIEPAKAEKCMKTAL